MAGDLSVDRHYLTVLAEAFRDLLDASRDKIISAGAIKDFLEEPQGTEWTGMKHLLSWWSCWRRSGRRSIRSPWSGGRGKERGHSSSGGETFRKAAGGNQDPVLQQAGAGPGNQALCGHVIH